MNTVQFGVFLSPRRDRMTALLDHAQTAENTGFHHVSIQDHPYAPDFLDPFAITGVLGGKTENLRFMTNVANLPLRPPAMLAKTAASLDVLPNAPEPAPVHSGSAPPPKYGPCIIDEFITAELFDTVNFVPEQDNVDQIEKFGTDVIPAAVDLVNDQRRNATASA